MSEQIMTKNSNKQ